MARNFNWREMMRSYSAMAVEEAPFGAAPMGVPSSGGSTSPAAGDGQNAGQLEPHTRAASIAQGTPYQLAPCYPPFIRLANDLNIVYFFRTRTLTFGGNGIPAAQTMQPFYFSVPTIIVARTAAAVMDDNVTGLQVGRSSLDTFSAQMFRGGTSTDLIDAGGGAAQGPVANALGSSLFGTAAQPGLIPGNGIFVDTAAYINVNCQILLDNIRVDITLWCIEEYGPPRG